MAVSETDSPDYLDDPEYVTHRTEGEKRWLDLLEHMTGIPQGEYIHMLVFNDLRRAIGDSMKNYQESRSERCSLQMVNSMTRPTKTVF